MAILLEFYGLPGAGKTTISRYLSDQLRQNNIRSCLFAELYAEINKKTKRYLRLSALIKMLGNFKFIVSYMWTTRSLDIADYKRWITLWIHYKWTQYLLLHYANTYDIIIFDQWVIQDLWSLFVFKRTWDDKVIYNFISTLNYKPYFVYCGIPVETACERIKERSCDGSRFKGNEITEIRRRLEPNYEVMQRIHHIISSIYTPDKEIIIDTNEPILLNIQHILSWLDNQFFGFPQI
jgi:thymidylate kinase